MLWFTRPKQITKSNLQREIRDVEWKKSRRNDIKIVVINAYIVLNKNKSIIKAQCTCRQ